MLGRALIIVLAALGTIVALCLVVPHTKHEQCCRCGVQRYQRFVGPFLIPYLSEMEYDEWGTAERVKNACGHACEHNWTHGMIAVSFPAGWTPTHWWAAVGDRASLSEAIADAPATVVAVDAYGRTPLHWSASLGQCQMAESLISAGADLHALDHEGKSPSDWARANHVRCDALDKCAGCPYQDSIRESWSGMARFAAESAQLSARD